MQRPAKRCQRNCARRTSANVNPARPLASAISAAAVVVLTALFALPPTPARAEEAGTDAPPARVSPRQGLQPNAISLQTCQVGAFRDGTDWGFVVNLPSGYVIGNCYDGWSMAQQTQPSCPSACWLGGFVYGDYNGCGFIRTDYLVSGGSSSSSACSTGAGRRLAEVASYVNCDLAGGEHCTDGTAVSITADCAQYANARPWTTTSGIDYLRKRPSPYTVLWRYVTLDGGYVMARDSGIASGAGNWVFMKRSCFGALPYAHRVP